MSSTTCPIELSKKKRLLSERELLKETEDLYAMHRDLLGGAVA